MTASSDDTLNEIQQELQHIRRLLIFALTRSGASQSDIAAALGLNQSSVSRMFLPIKTRPAKTKKSAKRK